MSQRARRFSLFLLFAVLLLYFMNSLGLFAWVDFWSEGPRKIYWRNQFLDAYHETGELLLMKPPNYDLEYIPAESLGDDEGFFLAYVWVDSLGLGNTRTDTYRILCATPVFLYFLFLAPLGRGHPRRWGYLASVTAVTILGLSTLNTYAFPLWPAGMFILLLLQRDEHEKGWYRTLILLFGLSSALSEQIRSHSGLIFLLFFAGYCLYKKRWGSLVILLLSYSCVTYAYNSEVDRLRESRNDWFHRYSGKHVHELYRGELLTSHALWHNLYLGLGFDRINDIVYHDAYAAAKAGVKIQGTPIVGGIYPIDTVYEENLERLYWQAVREYPVQTAWMYFKKLCLTAGFVIIFTGLLLEKDFGHHRARSGEGGWRAETVTLGLACFVLMAPGVLVLPEPQFFMGSVACAPGFILMGKAT